MTQGRDIGETTGIHNGGDPEPIREIEAGRGAEVEIATTTIEKEEEETETGQGPEIGIETIEVGGHGPIPGTEAEAGTGDARG